MLKLLKLKVSGYKMLPDNFEIDFLNKARVIEESDNNSEILEIDTNLYTFNLIAFTGKNSSGKTTVLELITSVLEFMKSGRWKYNSNDFSSDKIKLHIEFYSSGTIYLYDCDILPISKDLLSEIKSPYCSIKNEITKYAKYKKNAGKKYETKLTYEIDYNRTGIEDTSMLIFLCKDKLNGYNIHPFSKNGVLVSKYFFENLNFLDFSLTCKIIQLLDEGIEYIKFIDLNNIKFKRINKEETTLTYQELINILSNGTIKGIDLYIRVVLLLKSGGIMVIDEIENCFHKNLVNNLLFLITDKNINKNKAQIFFSTHYVEILDIFERRDNIFVLNKNENEICIKNLYKDFEIRTEILKSKQFNSNTFGTLLNYDLLMDIKGMIKNEISNND